MQKYTSVQLEAKTELKALDSLPCNQKKKKKKRTKKTLLFNKLEVKVWLQGEIGGHIFYQFWFWLPWK